MKIKKGFTLRTVGTEYIVTGTSLDHIDFNKLISLNPSAVYLWTEIEGKDFDTQYLADLLVLKYKIPAEQALADAGDIIKSWLEVGVVDQ